MRLLWNEIIGNRLLWLVVFVPIVIAAEHANVSETVLFVLSVLAIVPLAALLSHATESVAVKTGDAIGGLLNATLGNLTELVIAVTALVAGQQMLVKASIAGAIVSNTLFMLGTSFLLGGLKHHAQEFNAANGRLLAGELFLATIKRRSSATGSRGNGQPDREPRAERLRSRVTPTGVERGPYSGRSPRYCGVRETLCRPQRYHPRSRP